MEIQEVQVDPSIRGDLRGNLQTVLRKINVELSHGELTMKTARDLVLGSDGLIIPSNTARVVKTRVLDGNGLDIWEGAITLACLGHLLILSERFNIGPEPVLDNYQSFKGLLTSLIPRAQNLTEVPLASFLEANIASLFRQRGDDIANNDPGYRLARFGLTGFANRIAAFSWDHLDPRQWREMLAQVSAQGINHFLAGILEPVFPINPMKTIRPGRYTAYDLLVPAVRNGSETDI